MDPWPIEPQTGGNVAPANVVGRDDVIVECLRLLAAGNNVLLTDPRRMGKTSMLARLANEPGHRRIAVMLSYEGMASVDEFFTRTVKALYDHAGLAGRIKRLLDPILLVEAKQGPVSVKAAFRDKSRAELLVEVLGRVDRSLDDDEQLIVIMDEVPLAVRNIIRSEGPAVAEELLQKLRHVRGMASRLGWVLSGSIGFHHVLRAANTTQGVLNDLHPLPLGPLDDPSSRLLVKCLLLGIDRSAPDSVIDQLVQLTGGIPFLIHHALHQLSTGAGPVGEATANAAWATFIDSRDFSMAMTHQVTRLDEYPELFQRPAATLLDRVAVDRTVPMSFVAELVELDLKTTGDLIDLVVDDHYLVESANQLSWRYDVLRRIWARRRRLSPN